MNGPHRPSSGWCPRRARAAAAAGLGIAVLFGVTGGRSAEPSGGAFSRRPAGISARLAQQAEHAQRLMARAEDLLRAAKAQDDVPIDPEVGHDPSGLLGSAWSPLVTTMGSLEAKRVSTNPMWAHAITVRMSEAGLQRGDVVAAGFSGSFPGLNLAVMSACQALGVSLFAVSSVTASTWGANQPGFTWPEMESRIVAAEYLRRASMALTVGGESDTVAGLAAEDAELAWRILDRAAATLQVPALRPRDYAEAVQLRLSAYRRAANGRPMALYVNVGGASASLGRSPVVLRLPNGFIPARPFDHSEERGVMARFAEQGVRVLHLLNIRDLAIRWGVPLEGRASPVQEGPA